MSNSNNILVSTRLQNILDAYFTEKFENGEVLTVKEMSIELGCVTANTIYRYIRSCAGNYRKTDIFNKMMKTVKFNPSGRHADYYKVYMEKIEENKNLELKKLVGQNQFKEESKNKFSIYDSSNFHQVSKENCFIILEYYKQMYSNYEFKSVPKIANDLDVSATMISRFIYMMITNDKELYSEIGMLIMLCTKFDIKSRYYEAQQEIYGDLIKQRAKIKRRKDIEKIVKERSYEYMKRKNNK